MESSLLVGLIIPIPASRGYGDLERPCLEIDIVTLRENFLLKTCRDRGVSECSSCWADLICLIIYTTC